jgi:hypothetical protein
LGKGTYIEPLPAKAFRWANRHSTKITPIHPCENLCLGNITMSKPAPRAASTQ